MSAALAVAEQKGFSLALTQNCVCLPEAMLDGHIHTGARLFAVVQSIVLARNSVVFKKKA